MKTIKINNWNELPKNFTGIVESSTKTIHWFKEGKRHREDGPAIEALNGQKEWYKEGMRHRIDGPAIIYPNGKKEWHIEGIWYTVFYLEFLVEDSIYLGKEKDKYNLEWLRFLSDEGIEEFPIILGMEQDEKFKPLFDQVFGAPNQ